MNKTESSNTLHYVKSFDFLRGFAALIVLLLHGSYGFFQGGWIGVDLFFALSGFLITTLLIKEYDRSNKISIRKFYVRRVLRLLPALIICIILANLLWSITKLSPVSDRMTSTLGAIFYFTNLISGHVSGNMAHLWSLSIEEQFYLLWPLVVSLFLFKRKTKTQIIILIILICFGVTFRIIANNFQMTLLGNLISIDTSRFTLCRIDGILLGVLLAILVNKTNYKIIKSAKHLSTPILLGIFTFFIVILFGLNESNEIWRNGGFIVTNLLCVSMVLMAYSNPNHWVFSSKLINWVGLRSYGIYVYHFPIFLAFEGVREHHNLINLFLVTLARFISTLIIAELSFRYFEQPILKLKKRYEVFHQIQTNKLT